MEHLLLKAATTATDKGTFTAVISTASVDRDKDIIEPSAMAASLAKWAGLGKLVPLAWNHTDEVIGHIDPATARVEKGEVIADGYVDQSIPRGEEAWRLVKSGTLSFSFGFLFDPKTGATKLPNGRYRVKELDIFEISVIPVGPANNDTRVLSFKSAEEQRHEAERLAREVEEMSLPVVPEQPEAPVEPEPDVHQELQEVKAALTRVRAELEDLKRSKAEEAAKETKSRVADPLRQQADAVALEVASGGLHLPPPQTPTPRPTPTLELCELKRRMRDEMLGVLSGGTFE